MSLIITDANGFIKDASALSDPITVPHGGTGLTTVTQGDVLYASATNTFARRPKGTGGIKLLANTGVDFTGEPDWFSLVSDNDSEIAANGLTAFFNNFSDVGIQKTRNFAMFFMDSGGTVRAFGCVQGGSAAAVHDTRGSWMRSTTGAVIGNSASLITNTAWAWPDHNPFFMVRLRMGSDITNQRLFIGWWNGTTVPTNADTQAVKCVGLRYSTVAGDTGFTPITFDGTTQTLGTTMSVVGASEEYRILIRITGTTITYAIIRRADWSLVTSTLTMGSAAKGSSYTPRAIHLFTTAAVAKSCDCSQIALESGLIN